MTAHPPLALPPGRRPASLALRVLAVLVDGTLPSLVVTGWWSLVARGAGVGIFLVLSVLAGILLLGWGLLIWWMGALRGATPGMRLLDLECVDVRTGAPIGWGRFFARQVVYALLGLTVIGLPLMLAWLVLDPARRGWHDRSGGAVVLTRRTARIDSAGHSTPDHYLNDHYVNDHSITGHPSAAPATVALPAHLQGATSFQPVSTPGIGPSASAPVGPPGGWRPPDAPRDVPVWGGGPPAEVTMAPPTAEVTMAPPPPAEATMPPPFAEATMPPPDEGTVLRAPAGEGTVLRPRTQPHGWLLLLDDGRSIPLGAGLLLGRNPVAQPGDEAYGLVEVADTTRSVSKTHLLVAADQHGPWICDRGSTNGSGLVQPDGSFVEAAPGEVLRVGDGQLVTYGDHRLIVRSAQG